MKPAELNFDDLFAELELPLIMKIDQEQSKVDSQSLANAVHAYSKS